MIQEISSEAQAAIIAALISTVLTPFIQLATESIKSKKSYQTKIAPIIEHIRILERQLLQVPLNPNMEGIADRIAAIEAFNDPILIKSTNHYIKLHFVEHAKSLQGRHTHTRPWMNIEYQEEKKTFENHSSRLLAVLNKQRKIPELFDPSE